VQVERLTVDEGFLAGLDIKFVPGLNVLIGERGTGKTSVIELLRFVLGAGWFTDDAQTRGHQQALSVLGDGKATVTLFDGVERFTLSRTANDNAPQRVLDDVVTVLAQNEIEALGVQPPGRLRLIDRFRTDRSAEEGAPAVVARLRSLTAEIQGVLKELESLIERRAALRSVPAELEAAETEQTDLLSSIAATEDQRQQLASLQSDLARFSVRDDAFRSAETQIDEYLSNIRSLERTGLALDVWPTTANEPDQLSAIREELAGAAKAIGNAEGRVEASSTQVAALAQSNATARQVIDEQARTLRVALNRLQEGAGAITKRVEELRERRGQLDALTELVEARTSRVKDLTGERDAAYDALDELRSERFAARARVAADLSSRLGPNIKVSVDRSASVGGYVRQLINSLRGSGLHYNRLAPALAHELTPLEIVSAAEALAADAVSAATDLSFDRSLAMLGHLRTADLPDLIAAPIDDGVTMELLDGPEYKPSDRLSIGQRCTVVLPMLLAAEGGMLVVDQPEDHLDNAYVTTTLVQRLRSRSEDQQLIFSSHNPNIPVLGEANRVIVMGSDGSRGFRLHEGQLDDPTTVSFVTSLMEGGRDAFERRARFYARAWET
jgi:hypothetical protein